MAYDEGLAERIREVLADFPNVTEKKMFGGLCLLVSGMRIRVETAYPLAESGIGHLVFFCFAILHVPYPI